MFIDRSTQRGFAARLAALFPGLSLAGMAAAASASAAQSTGAVQKLDGDGKPAGKGNGLIYIAGQGAHSRGNKSDAGKTPTIEMHTQMVMDGVKATVEAGGGTMDSILQLTVFLAKLDYYDGMNSAFKTYFPNGGPARTTAAAVLFIQTCKLFSLYSLAENFFWWREHGRRAPHRDGVAP